MKFLLSVALAASLAATVSASTAPSADEAGVREALNNYLQGQATGNGDYYRKAFYPEAKLLFVRDGKLAAVTSEEFASRATGKPRPNEAQFKRRIDMVDITGNAAVAKIVMTEPEADIVDYMTLLKIDGSWRIINKSFHVEPKPRG